MATYTVEVVVVRDGEVVKEWDYVPEVRAEQGYECGHGWFKGEAEDPFCGWCKSVDIKDADFRTITVVECPICESVIKESLIIEHWENGCE